MIESTQNETYKRLLSLTTSKGLKSEGLFVLSGEKLIHEFLKQPSVPIFCEVSKPGLLPLGGTSTIIELASELFSQVDVLGTHFNLLVLEQPPIDTLSAEELASYEPDGIELGLPLGDPSNLGALLRSCEAFGVRKVILTKEAAHPFLPKAVKASAGSVLRVPMVRGPALSEFPAHSIALDTDGVSVNNYVWPAQGLLVVGEEGPGFGNKMFDTRICIPTRGVESLNVVVAASIALSRIPTDLPLSSQEVPYLGSNI